MTATPPGDAGPGLPRRPLVLVSVGTDHHRFDRLIDWVDAWLEAVGAERVDCVVQHGSSRAPRVATGSALIPHDELQGLMDRADVVVCHGGPTTIMEARRRGMTPVVVARSGRLGEHVDGHQEQFADRMAGRGLVALARSQGEFQDLLEAALQAPSSFAVAAAGPDAAGSPDSYAAATRFGELAAEVTGTDAGPRIPVLLIGGAGRSGTTLLERLLGQVPGMTSAGELVHLWQRGMVDDELCGCGAAFSACPFWIDVGKLAYGGWDRLDPEWVLDTRWAVDRTRRVPWLALPRLATPRYRRRMRAWARHLRALYGGLAAVGGGRVIDSSKHLSYALLLRHVGLDIRVVLVVRDPRAVAFSWSTVARRPEAEGAFMPRYGWLKSSVLWVVNTAGYGLLRMLRVPTLVVGYEQLMADPTGVLARIVSFAGSGGPAPDLERGVVHLAANHTAAGNPMRFRTGPIRLQLDSRWQQAMPKSRQLLVTALTWPWLLANGYPLLLTSPDRSRRPAA